MRVELLDAFHHPDSGFENSFLRIGVGVEHGRHWIADILTEELGELTAHVALHSHHQAVDGLHPLLHQLLLSAGLTPQVAQHGPDVLGDLFDLVERITLENGHHLIPQPRDGPESIQQIPDRVLGVGHLIGEVVECTGQFPALCPHAGQIGADCR